MTCWFLCLLRLRYAVFGCFEAKDGVVVRRVPGVALDGEVWRATAYDPVSKKKVRVKNPATGKTAFESQDAAALAKEQFERAKQQPVARVYTCDEWVTEWVTNPGYQRSSETTNRHNHERVKKFGEDFKGRLLSEVDRPTARKWAMENRQRANAVRTMLNDAVADQVLTQNPFSNLKLPQPKGRKNIEVLTVDEARTLIECGYELYEDWRVMGALITTACFAGLRIGELCGLKWDDLDWEGGTIHVQRQYRHRVQDFALPKSGIKRFVVMLDVVADALRELPRENDEFVFYGRRDHKMYSMSSHTYYWTPVRVMFHGTLPKARKEQIPVGFDFHELRHFCGSYLGDIGLSPQDIALQLGHTDGGKLAQELYVHTYRDNAFERIRSAHRKASGPARKAG